MWVSCGFASVESDHEQDDPYFNEFSDLVEVIDGKQDKSAIRSTFTDSMDTYKFVSLLTYRLPCPFGSRGHGAPALRFLTPHRPTPHSPPP